MRVNLTCHICGHKSVLSSITEPCPICAESVASDDEACDDFQGVGYCARCKQPAYAHGRASR